MNNIQKSIQDVQMERRNHLARSFSNFEEVTADDTKIVKAQGADDMTENKEAVDENPFEKAASEIAEEGIEKSDISDAVGYSENIRVTKTGKELKDQITDVLLPELNAKLVVASSAADTFLEDCGKAPKMEIDRWWTNGIGMKVPYKIYDWEETRINNQNGSIVSSLSAENASEKESKFNFPASEAEAQARRSYNEEVRKICDVMVDLKTCEILSKVKEDKEFELSPRQVLSLRF